MTDLSAPMFNDEAAARAYFEGIRWPNGPVCPRCGEAERVTLWSRMDADDGLLVTALSGQNAWASIEPEAVRFLKGRFG